MIVIAEKEIGDFTNEEIRDEYIERFGDPDDWDLSEVRDSDLREEYERRFGDEAPVIPRAFDEVMDLIADAARVSSSALRAYALLRDTWPAETLPLQFRQMLIEGRSA